MPRTSRRARGNIGIWAVLAFATVTAFMALAIHAGRSYANRNELQNAADSAALAAAAQLDGTQAGIDAATQAAAQFGAVHHTENVTVSVAASDLSFGRWDRATQTFTEVTGRTAGDLRDIIAVQVRDAREALPVAFGAFLGGGMTTTVRARSVAVGGGPCEDRCAFPGAFADCLVENPDGTLRCNDRFYVLNNDWQDNLGLTSLDPNQPASVPNIKAALQSCVDTSVDTQVPVSNGNPVNSVFTANNAHQTALTYPMEVLAPVVHPPSCPTASVGSNPRFVGDMPIVGYVSIIVCWVTGSTVHPWPPAQWGQGTTPAQQALWTECGAPPTLADFPGLSPTQFPDPFLKQTLFIKIRCHWIDPGTTTRRAGCQSFGLWTTRSRLVQ